MQTYKVRISLAARADMAELRKFLKAMMTEEGAVRYANNMRIEVKTLSSYAECYGRSTSATLRKIHFEARRMVSHNRKWVYVYHIDGPFVIVDRILPAQMNKG
jgi:plasmid stabilization system protein ParE